MSVYIDLTEFVNNPVLTGIQRVTAEICRNWPDERLLPVRFDRSRRLVQMPDRLIASVGQCFGDRNGLAVREIRKLREEVIRTIEPSTADVVLVPEVFYDPERVRFFKDMNTRELEKFRFIVYDLMPLVCPEHFPAGMPLDLICGYFCMLRGVPQCGFISEWTQKLYYYRLRRSTGLDGIVLRLGSDGLGPRPDRVLAQRGLHFCAIGTIEPRKNHALILDAFESLFRSCPELRLTFLGSMGWVEPAFAEKLRSAAEKWPGFTWISDARDDLIRTHLMSARASIYVSAAEGFGLPAVESLWLGTPVIASPNLPSLEEIGDRGVQILTALDSSHLQEAIRQYLDDSFLERKVGEATRLDLPSWRSFASQVAQWCAPATTH